jgi:hypothetical protein
MLWSGFWWMVSVENHINFLLLAFVRRYDIGKHSPKRSNVIRRHLHRFHSNQGFGGSVDCPVYVISRVSVVVKGLLQNRSRILLTSNFQKPLLSPV